MTMANTHAARAPLLNMSARARDHILVTLWFASTFKQFPYDELILYPVALYFAWAFVNDFTEIFPLLRRSIILFALPMWWLLSAAWGDETALILKSGAQSVLTMIICYCAVLRLDRRQIIVSMLISAGIFGILSFVSDGSGGIAARGVFSSKNAMGAAMVILWIAGLCILLDRQFWRPLRLAAVALLAISARMVVVSNSATAQLLAIGVTGVILLIGVLGAKGLGHPRVVLTACVTLSAICLTAAYITSTRDIDPVASLLASFGKDTSLTGRTDLWDYATAEIARHPWLGVGEGGFWTPLEWDSDARRIFTDYHKNFYSTFSFHNSYLEVAVHLGLIGLGITLIKTAWIFSKVLKAALCDPALPKVFFLAIALSTLARSTTESGLMAPFSLMTMVTIMGALFAIKDHLAPMQIAGPDSGPDR
jgi:exopolysaccharide production protein ExoQ